MKTERKRICSLLLSIVMLLSMVLPGFQAQAVAQLTYSGSSSYMSGTYYKRLTAVILTGSKRTDIVNIANSQVGYCESSSASQLSGTDSGTYGNYTEYGFWYGEYDAWCAAFVSWCANLAGVPSSVILKEDFTVNMVNQFKNQKRAYTQAEVVNGSYTPQHGDIIFFKYSSNNNEVNHVGIVTSYSNNTVHTVEGNAKASGSSVEGVVAKTHAISSTNIVYICCPDYEQTGTTGSASTGGNNSGSSGSGSGSDTSGSVTIPDDLKDWVFNANYYRKKYSNLSSMTDAQLYEHFKNTGVAAGHQASALFNVSHYLSQHQDLINAYGSTGYVAAFNHFRQYGQYEIARQWSAELVAIKNYIFNAEFYQAMYPSVAQSVGTDTGDLFAHFIKTGIENGYTASPVFDIAYYTSANSDLEAAFGTSYYEALHHFIRIGQTEPRIVSKILDTKYYIQTYSDAASLNGFDAMKHFNNTGLPAGRQGCDSFLRDFYYFANVDVLSGYTKENCYIHYIKTGYDAGYRSVPLATFPENCANLGDSFTATITNQKSQMNVHATSTKITIYTPGDTDSQKWKFERQSDGSYKITNVYFDKVLTTSDNGSAAGVLSLEEYTGSATQHWFLYDLDGYHTIGTACNRWTAIGLCAGLAEISNTVEMTYLQNDSDHQYLITVVDTTCKHESTYSNIVAATCVEDGTQTIICSDCGKVIETIVLSATGHTYRTAIDEPTCTDNGYLRHTCQDCGYSYTSGGVSATGHSFILEVCEDCGIACLPVCTICGDDAELTQYPCGDRLYYTMYDGIVHISGTGDMYSKDEMEIAWPGYIHTAAIDEGVNSIGNHAFSSCSLLESIIIPDSVTTIGSHAFVSCESLISIQIPEGVKTIEEYTFATCTSLESISLPDGLTTIGDFAFIDCSTLEIEKMPSSLTSIGNCAFIRNHSLTDLIIPENVNSIESDAFGDCEYLTTITFEGSAPVIAEDAFFGVTADVYYPVDNPTWTADMRQDYGGTLTWINPTLSPTIQLKYPTLTFEDEILMNVYFDATDLQDVVEMGLITYTESVADANVNTANAIIPGYTWSEADGFYYTTTNGIAAKDLGDEIYFAVYAKLIDGSYTYSKVVSYSPSKYAYASLTNGSEAMKPIVVAMLNYGTAAQNFFGYRTDAPVNGELTINQYGLAEAYRSDMITAVSTPSADKQGTLVNNGGFSRRYPTVSFEGAFCINYYCIPSATVDDEITMYYWDQVAYDANEVLNMENATDAIPMVLNESTGEYLATVDGIAAKDLDKGIYISFVYSDGTTTYSSGVLAYSIGTYCAVQAAGTGTAAELAKATAVYGFYAKELFNLGNSE